MLRKRNNILLRHEHWFAEWWSAILLISVGVYGASFMSSVLFLWGVLNIFFYSQQWHFSLIAWAVFALINLYALARILSGIEANYEHF